MNSRAAPDIRVNGYSEGWLRKFFPWVYDDEIDGGGRRPSPGSQVLVRAKSGEVLGRGIAGEGHVAVRIFRFDDGPLDRAWWTERVDGARTRRRCLSNTNAWRWLHGENDDLPGVRLDVWDRVGSLSLDSPSLEDVLPELVAVLQSSGVLDGLVLCTRRHDNGVLQSRVLFGSVPTEVVVQEGPFRLHVKPAEGTDAGLYSDMRELRRWLEPHWRGTRVLNTYAFTGAFSLAAAAGGAAHVTTVDLSTVAIERVRANLSLLMANDTEHRLLVEDTFKALDRFRRTGETFDRIIADPPSFAHGPEGLWVAARDYPRLISACARVLAPGGWLLAATNQGKVSPKDFQKQIQDGLRKANRSMRIVHQGSPPLDFPCSLQFPESRYLKAWVLEV